MLITKSGILIIIIMMMMMMIIEFGLDWRYVVLNTIH